MVARATRLSDYKTRRLPDYQTTRLPDYWTTRLLDYQTKLGRYKALVEYDGTDFSGFQRQAPLAEPTVQGTLEAALAAIGKRHIGVAGAGRTDSGVHATGQVIAFELEWRHPAETLARALNAHLPRSVAVRGVAECPPDFHPRFSAKGRKYRYSIYNAPARAPRQERFAWRVWPALDVEALQTASARLIGRRDFAAFGSAPGPGGHTVREVREARWESSGGVLNFYIVADAFLYRMVRSIVGALRRVGHGELTPGQFEQILASADRHRVKTLAPPNGLCLVEVLY